MKYCIRRENSHGQVLVFVAIGIIVILGTIALATDVAVFYFNWAQLRKEVDAAVLAGANFLPNNPSTATSTASTWVQTNGLSGDQILKNTTGSLGYNNQPNTSLTVTVQRTVPYYFARVFGLTSAPVTVTGTAGVQPLEGASGWLPVGMPCKSASCYDGSSCTPNPDGTGCYSCGANGGTSVTLNPSQAGPGDWGALSCPADNPGASGYVQALTVGCSTYIAVGDAVAQSKPGNPVLTARGIQDHLGSSSSCMSQFPGCMTSSTETPSSPCEVLVPLVDTSQYVGRDTAPVLGFAVAWITGYSGNTVTVEFMHGVTSAGGSPSPTGPDSGAFAPVLIQ